MKKKLKDIQKGDWIALIREGDGKLFPWQVSLINFQDEKVWDLILVSPDGKEKRFGYLDWNKEVTMAEAPEMKVCPCCGRRLITE